MYDILIKNANIIDGTGSSAFVADIAIKDEKIVSVSKCIETDAKETINADGMLVIPGIIDAHSHFDTALFSPEFKYKRVQEGITTDIVGYCGPSAAPFDSSKSSLLKSIYYSLTGTGLTIPWSWKNMDEYFSVLEHEGLAGNVASFVGHGTIRTIVMGHESRKPTPYEISHMCSILSDSIDQGALGIALGLSYVPGMYSDENELVQLGRIIEKKGAMMAAHRRDEGNRAVEAVDEVLNIAEQTGAKVHVCHLKVMGKKNWGKAPLLFERIDRTRKRGIDVKFDVYPYVTGYIKLHYIFPGWVISGSESELLQRFNDVTLKLKILKDSHDPALMSNSLYSYASPEGILIVACDESQYVFRTLAEIAADRNEDPIECAIGLIQRSNDNVMMAPSLQNQGELDSIVCHPLSMICSDGAPSSSGSQHPRYIGTFSKFLSSYVKQNQLISLEDAVRKMTGLTAEHFGLKNRGHIIVGDYADMVLIDWLKFNDNTSFSRPNEHASGIETTIVNGKIVYHNGVLRKICNGKIIKSF